MGKVMKVMNGVQLAKFLLCIKETKRLKWTKGAMVDGDNSVCSLGMLARHAGARPSEIETLSVDLSSNMNLIPLVNDRSATFDETLDKFKTQHKTTRFGVGEYIAAWKKKLKDYRASN